MLFRKAAAAAAVTEERLEEPIIPDALLQEEEYDTERIMGRDKEVGLSEIAIQKSPSSESSRDLDVGEKRRMRVLVRIRPLNKVEIDSKANQTPTIQANNDEKTLQIYNPDGKISVMSFNHVFDQTCDQLSFFDTSGVGDLITQALRGYVTTIFAFGQTGSGKTFTITGPTELRPSPETVGLVPRSLEFMFDLVKKQKESKEITSIRIQASYLEIYNENVLDLLNPRTSGLPVRYHAISDHRWSADRGFFVENLFIVDCDSLDDCLAVLEEGRFYIYLGLRNKTMGSHQMNEHSSRSHSVLTIYLEIQGIDQDNAPQHRYGKVSFVDLAGSEKVKESKTTLDTFAEALSINKSLLTLGKCITTLADPKSRGGHVPFRDSKLTKLLADSLSGHGMAMMIACISPAFQNLNETLKTVRYALQARKIEGKPVIQLDPQEEMVMTFKMEIQMLRKENIKLKDLILSDPKYREGLKKISNESEEIQKKLKSRPGSPILKPRAINYYKSSIPTLPEIKERKTPVKSHSRKGTATANQPFSSSMVERKSLKNALPRRLSQKLPKSAARSRIDEMKRSLAPAGISVTEKNPRSSKKEISARSLSRSQTPSTLKSAAKLPAIKAKVNPPPKPKSQPNGGLMKRPSAIESIPQVVKEPFPEEKPPAVVSVTKAVENRHETMNEVHALDKEILKMKKNRSK